MKDKLKTLFTIFSVFFRIGAFTFGGGYAMIPLIQKETVESKQWITDDDLLDIVAIAESTPGPIVINTATFVGYKIVGFWGSFFATLGVVIPSFLIILGLSFILNEFKDNQTVKFAFEGIRAGVLAMLIKALWTMYKKVNKSPFSYILMATVFILVAFIHIHVVFCIIGCGIFGLIWSVIAERNMKIL